MNIRINQPSLLQSRYCDILVSLQNFAIHNSSVCNKTFLSAGLKNIITNCCEAVRRAATLIITQQSLHVGCLCTLFGETISNLSTVLSVVPDFSEDARNMVEQRIVSVVRVFGQCSANAPLQYMSC